VLLSDGGSKTLQKTRFWAVFGEEGLKTKNTTKHIKKIKPDQPWSFFGL
jgi:hypothetical protein